MINALHPRKFPMFAASLVAGINLLEPMFLKLLKRNNRLAKSPTSRVFVSTLLAALISAIVTFPTYQTHVLGYGRYNSLDLTLLVATRALDTTLRPCLKLHQAAYRVTETHSYLLQVALVLCFVGSFILKSYHLVITNGSHRLLTWISNFGRF